MARRRHSKINTFPKEIQDLVVQLVMDGVTYEAIKAHLADLGHETSKSAVGRFALPVLNGLERLKVVKELVMSVKAQGGSGLEMEETASQLWMQKMIEYLMTFEKIEAEPAHKLITALAKLQQSSAQREGVKIMRQKIEKAVKAVEEVGKKKNIDPADLQKIKEEFYGLTK